MRTEGLCRRAGVWLGSSSIAATTVAAIIGLTHVPIVRALASSAAPSAQGDEWLGKAAPPFSLDALEGGRVRLADFRGKVVIVNFWATWCAPCKVEIPWLVEFYMRYHARGLEILGVSVDDGERERVAKFVHDRHVNYRILLKDEAVSDAYGGLRFLPQTFFVGRDGRILVRTYGIRSREDLEAEIRNALGLPLSSNP